MSSKPRNEEARLIRSLAKQERLTESKRRRAKGQSNHPSPVKHVRCPNTGAMIFGKLNTQPPLTTEMVHDLLIGFP